LLGEAALLAVSGEVVGEGHEVDHMDPFFLTERICAID
jgi:hypothetical protein